MTVEQFIQQIRGQVRGTWSDYGLHKWYPYYIAENPDYTSATTATTTDYFETHDDYCKWLIESRWGDACSIDPMSRVSVSFSEPEPCSPEELEEFLKGD